MENVLVLEKISKRYSGLTVLDNVSFALKRGRIYGLVGNEHSGKTTILRIIAGFGRADSGTMEIFGESTESGLMNARRRMGFLIENPIYFDDLSAKQNLIAQSMIRGKVDKQEISRLLSLVGVKEYEVLKNASHSVRRLYGLAFALMDSPGLVILDEPVNGMDSTGTNESKALLKRLNEENGTTMLISSHLPAELYEVVTDYLFIDKGKIYKTATNEEIERESNNDPEAYFASILGGETK